MNILFIIMLGWGMAVPAYAQSPSAVDPSAVVGPPAGPSLSGPELELATRQTSTLLRCPVCQGLSVEASPSESAQAMRKEVMALRAEGYSHEQTVEYFEASYGDFIRLEPKKEGFALWVWVLPVGFLAIGGLLVGGSVKRQNVASSPLDPELQATLERVRRETAERE